MNPLKQCCAMDDATSTTSLEVVWCFSCNLRPVEYKVTCQKPSCEQFRGKIQVCQKCALSCPRCKSRLSPDDIKTVSGVVTQETFTSRAGGDQGDGMVVAKGDKGKGNAKGKAKGKGGRGPKGQGKVRVETRSEKVGIEGKMEECSFMFFLF